MSWLNLNQSLSGLKGQFKNLANEVFSEGIVEDTDPFTELSGANDKIKELQNLCASQDAEIKILRRQNATLHQEKLNALSKNNGANTSAAAEQQSSSNDESSWFWDPPDGESSTNSQNTEKHENQALHKKIHELQNEISILKNESKSHWDSNADELQKELNTLREENKNLSRYLEDLDLQNQTEMNKVLAIKKELQKNYENLLPKYEKLEKENNEFKARFNKTDEENSDLKEMTETNMKLISDLDTLHHKYDNLEKVHRLLTENTEKFQEDNMELSEENFRLQEECSRLQNDLEELQAISQSAPKKYKELENKFFDLEKKFAERDNPRSIDAVMETIHDTKAQEIIAQLKFEIVELQNKLNTNEEIKRLNLEIDHLKKEIEILTEIKTTSIPCDAFKTIIDKYITFNITGVSKPLKTSANDLLTFAEASYKILSDIRSKNESLEIRVSESSRTINELQSSIDELNAEMEILNGDLSHYEHECSELKKNNDFLIAEIGALKSVSKLEPILEHNEEHLAKLQGELDDCCKLNTSFETKMEEKERQFQIIVEERDRLKEEMKQLAVLRNQLQENQLNISEDKALEKKLTSAQSEIEKLKSQLYSTSVDNEKSKIDITILDNDKVLLLREMSELKANLQSKSIIEDHVKKMEAEKGEVGIKLSMLVEENNELKERIKVLDESSEVHFIKLKEELAACKKMVSDGAKTVSEKDEELEVTKSKVAELVKKLQDNFNIITGINNKFIVQCKEMTLSLGLNIDDITLSTNFEDLDNFGLARAIDVFVRIQQFISTLEDKKLELLNESKENVSKMNATVEMNNSLAEVIASKTNEISKLQESINHLQNEVTTKDSEKSALMVTVNDLQSEISATKEELNSLLVKNKSGEENSGHLAEIVNTHKVELSVVKAEKENLIIESQNQIKALSEDLNIIKECLVAKETEITKKEDQIKLLNESILNQQKEIEILNNKLIKLTNEINNTSLNEASSEELIVSKTTLMELEGQKENLNSELVQLRSENEELKSNLSSLQKQCEISADKLKEIETSSSDVCIQLNQLNSEKSELINLVTQKHHESVMYHGEIQRLNSILLTENERYQELERIYAATREQKTTGAQAGSEELHRLNEMLKEKNNKCVRLEKQINEFRNSGVTVDEMEKLKEKNQFLVEKCDLLAMNLVMEQNNTKQIAQEKMQILEKEQSMTRELERLRQHLVDMEEEHTRELVSAEQKLQEAQVKLTQAEDKVKQSSTLYTSNSIRTNQEVETLRTQIKLMEKQREDIQSQLSQSEDRNSKNLAALTNLQCVLEQFQMDKEREGEAVAGKARRDLESAREEIIKLHKQISELEEKLRDSSTGLRAASRLSAQLDARTAQVHEAKEQVGKLEDELATWKKKYKDAISNQQDKVDKSLVKNLLMGYIQTSTNQKPGDRIQVLRLLSTVLDFDQTECERVGLGTKSSSAGGLGADSLAQEFIKFLEKESQPQLKVGLPNLLHLGNPQGPVTPPHSSKDSPRSTPRPSTNSPQRLTTPSPQLPATSKPVPVIPMAMVYPTSMSAPASSVAIPSNQEVNTNQPTINNTFGQNAGFNNSLTGGFSLFTPIANPDVAVNQTRNSEGAILKNILKES